MFPHVHESRTRSYPHRPWQRLNPSHTVVTPPSTLSEWLPVRVAGRNHSPIGDRHATREYARQSFHNKTLMMLNQTNLECPLDQQKPFRKSCELFGQHGSLAQQYTQCPAVDSQRFSTLGNNSHHCHNEQFSS